MKIAIIGNSAFSMVNFRGLLIKDLVSSGWQVHTIAPGFGGGSREILESLGAIVYDVPLDRTGINPLHDLGYLINLIKLLRKIQPDIAFAYALKPVIYGLIASKIAKISKRVAMFEGLGHVFIQDDSIKKKVLRNVVENLLKTSLCHADKVIFLNNDDIKEIVQKKLVKEQQAYCLGPIGIDLNEWQYTSLPTNHITFTIIARLIREKGILEFLEAAKIVKEQHPDVQFIVLGDIDKNPSSITRDELQDLVNDGIIEWPGHVEVKPWLERTSVFVLPSYREGVPRSTQEAMAMGKPVITTDVPGCRDTVIPGVNGFLIPPKSVQALVNAMNYFINNRAAIETMGANSRKIAEERFCAKKQNEKIIKLLST